jgi:preprotein translocase subunit SecF
MSTEPTHGLASRLYRGETAFNFIGRRNRWFAISGTVILIGLVALGVRGLNFGIDFRGGSSWEVPAKGVSVASARDAVRSFVPDATVQTVGSDIRVAAKVSSPKTTADVSGALAKLANTTPDKVNVDSVGPTWGNEISHKAERALVFFLIAIFAFIWLRFSEWKMSLSALIALAHDILVTVGVYAVFGFPVTPATVIAVLTILGYSLYDTVVVFDKVDENTRGLALSGRMTYSDTVNLSMNQVLMRSINTSLVAIMPILSVLVIGSVLLGATTLREFGLALFVGLVTGAYSSIFIAAQFLAMMKEREQRYTAIRQRIEARGGAGALLTPAAAAAAAGNVRAADRRSEQPVDEDADLLTPAAATASQSQPSGASRTRQPPPRPRSGGARPAPRGRKKGKRR